MTICLAGCASAQSSWQPQNTKYQEVVDTTPQEVLQFLTINGYPNSLITGSRTSDCRDDHTLTGYGVLLKTFNKSGKPEVKSGIVCVTWDKTYVIELD